MIFKKTITIMVAVAIVVVINIYFTKMLNKYTDEIYNNLEKMNLNEVEYTWKEAKNKFKIFVEHDDLEEIENEIGLIKINLEKDEVDKVKENIKNIKDKFDYIKENNELSLTNIF